MLRIGDDRQGRSFDFIGKGRHAMEVPSDAQKLRVKAFLMRVFGFVDQQFSGNKFDRLIIVAFLRHRGHLRTEMTKAVSEVVSAEVTSDLTRVPNSELGKHLKDILSV